MARTKDGKEALYWCGKQPAVSKFTFFTDCKVEARVGGALRIFRRGKSTITMEVGQWLVKDGGDFKVVDDDKIELAPKS